MLNLLAQTNTVTTTDVDGGALAVFGGAFLLVWLVVAVVMVASFWKIFQKAGRPGWVAIVPVYNTWVLAEIAGKPGWWGILPWLSFIPVLGIILGLVGFVLSIIISIELAKAFGKEPVFAVMLILVGIVGYPMLAFGDAKYAGAGGQAGPAPSTTPVDTTPEVPQETPTPPAAPTA